MNSNNKIKESFVAFVDVLGFEKMIEEDGGTGKNLEIIKNAIEKGTARLKEMKNDSKNHFTFWFEEFKVKSFSDCFCFSIPLVFDSGQKNYKQNFIAFYIWLMVFYNELLDKGFLCRGGITQNWHYVDKDIIFSKGLIEAYKLESKLAKHPIILINEKNLLIKINEKINEKEILKNMIIHDNSGRNFLNPFNYFIVENIYFNDRYNYDEEVNIRNKLLIKFLKIIEKEIIEYKDDTSVEKYQFLKELVLFVKDGEYSDKFTKGIYFKNNLSN